MKVGLELIWVVQIQWPPRVDDQNINDEPSAITKMLMAERVI